MAHILVVDDDPQVGQTVTWVLEDDGHRVSVASGGQEALKMIAVDRPDLVILDIIMPDMDGIEVCRRIRADPFIRGLPILFLTAKGRANDVAQGLDAGGDDYLTKPFQVVELPARVRALLRRVPGGLLDTDLDHLTVGDLRVHTTLPDLQVGERRVYLTVVEHRLLYYLMQHAGQPISTEQLLEDVWDYPAGTGNPKLVQVHIANLRAKIESDPASPRFIRTVHGRGYVLDIG